MIHVSNGASKSRRDKVLKLVSRINGSDLVKNQKR